jgi:hypothetical protein
MPRNMVSGKPSNQSARGVDIPPTTHLASSGYLCSTCGNTCCKGNQEYGFCSRATDVCPALWKCVWSCSRLWWTCPRVGMKGKWLLRNYRWMFQACELGLPCKVKFDLESSASHADWDRLIPLPHRVTRAIILLWKMMVDQRLYHACIDLGAYLEWIFH